MYTIESEKIEFFFNLQINGVDVTQASHENVVSLIRRSGDTVKLSVVTVPNIDFGASSKKKSSTLPRNTGASLSLVPNPPPPPKRDPKTTLSVGKTRAVSMVADLAAIGE